MPPPRFVVEWRGASQWLFWRVELRDPLTMQTRWGVLAGFLAGCAGEIEAPAANDASMPTDGRIAVPGGVGEPTELVGITLYHNEVRAAVATSMPLPPLEWDPALAQTAADWVAMCRDSDAPIGLIDHNPSRSVGHPYYVGENIFGSGGSATAKQAVETWAAEQASYDHDTNTCSGICGHYTQIVWRTTVKLGCAKGTCAGLAYGNTIVCNYGPGGNSGGRPY